MGRNSAYARAYHYRDRLTERERLGTTAFYFHVGPGQDQQRAAAAYAAQLALDSTNTGTLNNYGILLVDLREFARAEAVLRRAFALRASPSPASNLANALVGQGRVAAAESTLAAARTRFPDAWRVPIVRMQVALDGRAVDTTTARGERLLATGAEPATKSDGALMLAIVALKRGQPALGDRGDGRDQCGAMQSCRAARSDRCHRCKRQHEGRKCRGSRRHVAACPRPQVPCIGAAAWAPT